MKTRIKPVTSLTTLALFVVALTCDASIAAERSRYSADKEIRTCVSAVNRKADYSHASRVVHRIVELDQKNLEELEIRIETAVYHHPNDAAVKEYEASCTTGSLGKLIRFRINQTGKSD
jgi:hypothetical protein